MLDHLYAKFDKAYYAGLCKAIAIGEDIASIHFDAYILEPRSLLFAHARRREELWGELHSSVAKLWLGGLQSAALRSFQKQK